MLAVTVIFSSFAAAQSPATGLRPRATPADYPVFRQTAHATYAATLVPADQVRHLFSIDISKKYIVFEIAVYPSQTSATAVDPGDLLIKSGSDFVRPTDASTIAALIQDKNTPRLPNRGPQVTTAATVGYETGTDPYTGRNVHGVYTAAEVGVDTTGNNYPPPPPRPGSSPQDRAALENQLADKALPPGTFTAPVAGLVYFAADQVKKPKNVYNLQCVPDNAPKIDLEVPAKQK